MDKRQSIELMTVPAIALVAAFAAPPAYGGGFCMGNSDPYTSCTDWAIYGGGTGCWDSQGHQYGTYGGYNTQYYDQATCMPSGS